MFLLAAGLGAGSGVTSGTVCSSSSAGVGAGVGVGAGLLSGAGTGVAACSGIVGGAVSAGAGCFSAALSAFSDAFARSTGSGASALPSVFSSFCGISALSSTGAITCAALCGGGVVSVEISFVCPQAVSSRTPSSASSANRLFIIFCTPFFSCWFYFNHAYPRKSIGPQTLFWAA